MPESRCTATELSHHNPILLSDPCGKLGLRASYTCATGMHLCTCGMRWRLRCLAHSCLPGNALSYEQLPSDGRSAVPFLITSVTWAHILASYVAQRGNIQAAVPAMEAHYRQAAGQSGLGQRMRQLCHCADHGAVCALGHPSDWPGLPAVQSQAGSPAQLQPRH